MQEMSGNYVILHFEVLLATIKIILYLLRRPSRFDI
jgi:hypothetical protein